MQDDHENNSTPERGWLSRLTHFLSHEPEDRADLLAIMRVAKERALIDTDAFDMIEGVLQVAQTQVRDIMIPRAQMVVIECDQPFVEILSLVIESGHSRFPVVGEDRDDVIGILLAKDLLRFAISNQAEFNLKTLIRPTTFVPESKRLNVLLKEFRSNRNHMAIVVDEYGGVIGLITIEDVLEEIVGDIEDESDTEATDNITAKTGGEYSINALTPIEEFNTYFQTNFSDVEFDTIGGLIMHHLGYLPKVGEIVNLDTFVFTVTQSDARRVLWLTVKQTVTAEKTELLAKTANE